MASSTARLRSPGQRQRLVERFSGGVGLVSANVDDGFELQHADAGRPVEQALFFAQLACRLDILFGLGKFGGLFFAAGLALGLFSASWSVASAVYKPISASRIFAGRLAGELPRPGRNTRPRASILVLRLIDRGDVDQRPAKQQLARRSFGRSRQIFTAC